MWAVYTHHDTAMLLPQPLMHAVFCSAVQDPQAAPCIQLLHCCVDCWLLSAIEFELTKKTLLQATARQKFSPSHWAHAFCLYTATAAACTSAGTSATDNNCGSPVYCRNRTLVPSCCINLALLTTTAGTQTKVGASCNTSRSLFFTLSAANNAIEEQFQC